MFLLLPVIGGFLAGLLARRRIAVPIEIALFAIGAAVFVSSGPRHDTSYAESLVFCIPAAVVCAAVTALGMYLRNRRARRLS